MGLALMKSAGGRGVGVVWLSIKLDDGLEMGVVWLLLQSAVLAWLLVRSHGLFSMDEG